MTEAFEATRIETLRLKNYRRFEDTIIEFHPELTVLVSPNGGGKTAVLDALVSLWWVFADILAPQGNAMKLTRDDVRRIIGAERTMEPVLPAMLSTTGVLSGAAVAWGHGIHTIATKAQLQVELHEREHLQNHALSLRKAVLEYTAGKSARAPLLPMVCSYGTGRLWSTRRSKKTEVADTSRFSGYADCLSPASSFRSFESWFRRFSYEAQSELSSGRASPHNPGERLAGVRAAVGKVLAPSGWQQLEWDFAEDALVSTHPDHGRLPVRLLSDGIRTMIGLAGDIAHRAVRLNPPLSPPSPPQTPGIVMIDEVDMHLHPGWQQTVVPSLREAFPAMQLIVTTHSHLVISTVPSRCIRILEADGSVLTPSVETQGYESPFALGVVFGVNTAPPIEIARQLTRYRALLELGQGDTEEAVALKGRLLAHFGATHPAMLDAEGLRRLQAFKARIAAGRGGS